MSRYFVTVYARSSDDLRRLQGQDLDLFPPTAREERTDSTHRFAIEGLVTIKEAENLVGGGYQVRLEDPIEARSNTGESVEFSSWLEGMQTHLATDKAVRQ